MPSLPLPTRTPYRLTLPLVSRRNLNGRHQAALAHTRPLAVRDRLDGHALRAPLRHAAGLHVSHAARSLRALRAIRSQRNPVCGTQLTRAFANQADAVIVPTQAMAATAARARRHRAPRGRAERHRRRALRRGAPRRGAALAARSGPRRSFAPLRRPAREGEECRTAARGACAARATTSLKLVVAGDGPLRAELERRAARSAGIDRATRFLGVVPREELPKLYASADAFIMPSTTETQGLVMAEAMAAGAVRYRGGRAAKPRRPRRRWAHRRRPTPRCLRRGLRRACAQNAPPAKTLDARRALRDRRTTRSHAGPLRKPA